MNKKNITDIIIYIVIASCITGAVYGIYRSFYNINKKLDSLDAKIMQASEDLKDEVAVHSVHPVYGNYVKCDSNGNTCNPWQYCPKNVYSQMYDILMNENYSSIEYGEDNKV